MCVRVGVPLKVPAASGFRAGGDVPLGSQGHQHAATGGGACSRSMLTVGRRPQEDGGVCRADGGGSLALLRDQNRGRKIHTQTTNPTPCCAAAARARTDTREDARTDVPTPRLQPWQGHSPDPAPARLP